MGVSTGSMASEESTYRHTRTSPRQAASPPRTMPPHRTEAPTSTRRAAPAGAPAPPVRAIAEIEPRAAPPKPVSPGRDVSPRAIRPSQDLNRNTSPVKLRMQHLANRLQGLQDELQAEKTTAVDDKNIKRMRIESRYTKPRLPMPTDDDRVTMLAEQMAVTRKELSELMSSREDFEDQSTKVIKAVESHINLDLTVEKRARKDLEQEKKLRMESQTVYHQTLEDIMEISKNIDLEAAARKQQETNVDKHLMDEVGLLRDLCDQVRNKRESLEIGFKEKLDAEFMALNLDLERERKLRAKMEFDHQNEIESEILNVTTLIDGNCKKAEEEESDNLKGLLMEEHGNRDESEKSMVRLLDEMYTKLHREVEEERKDRENTQERFIRMLEGLA